MMQTEEQDLLPFFATEGTELVQQPVELRIVNVPELGNVPVQADEVSQWRLQTPVHMGLDLTEPSASAGKSKGPGLCITEYRHEGIQTPIRRSGRIDVAVVITRQGKHR